MATAAEVITGVLVLVLLAITAFAMLVGIMGGVFGEGFARCDRCGHLTLSIRGQTHPGRCPGTLREHLMHVGSVALHHAHLRHHS